jgi:hypothetical protein
VVHFKKETNLQKQVHASALYFAPTILAVMLCAVWLVLTPPTAAQAAAIGCRTDPFVTLSNGDVVIITTDIASLPEDINAIEYTLHVQPGITATSIVYTADELGIKEKLKIVDDAPPGAYITDTKVKTKLPVLVIATSNFENLTRVAVGLSNTTLTSILNFDPR